MNDAAFATPSGGSAPTDGLVSRADVAVWAALQLAVIKKLAPDLLIEAASQEDAEADVTPLEPAFESAAAAGGRRSALRARWRSGALSLDEAAAVIRDDRSSLVRRMLAQELATTPTVERLDLLLALADDTWAHHSISFGEAAQYPIARVAAVAITELPELADDRVSDVLKVAIRTDDPHVRWLLLLALGVRGSDDTRRRLVVFGCNSKRKPSDRLAVVDGITAVAEHLGLGSLPAPPTEAILTAPPPLAVALTRFFAQVASPTQVVDVAKALNAAASRRVLLLLLNGRADRDLGEKLAALLPQAHPARRLVRHPAAKSRLPRAAVDDLGDVLLVEAVRQALGDRFEPEVPTSSPTRRGRGRRRTP